MPDPTPRPPAHGSHCEPFLPPHPLVLGLIGGIAAGKSAVAAAFADHGLAIVDADQVARAVTQEAAVLAALREEFGPGMLLENGTLDRAALGAIVFRNREARERLERITHPAIRARILTALAAHHAAGASVVLDAPLLLEGGLVDWCHWVVFVDTDESVRRSRAAARGWAPGELSRREASQLPLTVKSARAHATIRNSGSLLDTRRQVADLLLRCASTPPPAMPKPSGPLPEEPGP